MTDLLLIVAAAAVLVLVALAVVAALRKSGVRAGRRLALAAVLVLLYAAALVIVGVTSRAETLALGRWKCFDDWCVTLRSVTATPAGRQLTLAVRNGGRGRTQRPDAPRAVLEPAGGPPVRIAVVGLDQQLSAGQTAELTYVVTRARAARLVVTEGGWPSRLVIGDENSPWHAHSGWNL